MNTARLSIAISLTAAATLAPSAAAQPTIEWFTIDCGGGVSTGGPYTLAGTIGQSDAGGPLSGGSFTLAGGFWPGLDGGPAPCPADWNGDGLVNSGDITAFLTAWLTSLQQGTLFADFNGDGQVNSGDITAFLTAWITTLQGGGC